VTQRSLRGRLRLVGGIAILVVLALSIAGLSILFDRHVQRVAVTDLEERTYAVAAMIEPDGEAGPGVRAAPIDPRYERPLSGHYWQLELGDDMHRSRSLWDYVLPNEGPPQGAGTTRILSLPGPQGKPLLAVETWLQAGERPSALPVRIVVATDRDALDAARAGFLSDLLPYSVLLALLLGLAFWAQLTLGLLPLRAVSERVAALRTGRVQRIGTDLPAEVLPLAGEIDALLDVRETELVRARNRASDLAHGMKTPLQALLGDAAELRRSGEADLADSVEGIAGTMRRLVDRELSRARIRSGQGAPDADASHLARGVVGVLRRTPDGARLDWQVDIPSGLTIRIDPDDLVEVLGALAENAARHARARVVLAARAEGDTVVMRVQDDGPGVPPDLIAGLGQRGIRADERTDGSGLGLAIAADIVAAAGGAMTLRNLDPGFEVALTLRGR
jgi:signal transduction histidine kinase